MDSIAGVYGKQMNIPDVILEYGQSNFSAVLSLVL